MKNKGLKKLTYEEQYAKCVQFIKNFQDYESGEIDQIYGRKKYLIKMQKVSNDEINAIEILYEDLESFFRKEDERTMLESMKINTKRYIDIFSGIILSRMPKSNKSYSSEEQMKNRLDTILKDQRMDNYSIKQSNTQNRQQIPLCAHKKFDVWIIYGMNSKLHIHTISQFNAEQIGSLVVCKAIVMRTSQIKPVIVMATYACDICGCQNYQQIKDQNYKPLTKCISKKCQENKLNGKLTFLPGHSTFISYQQLKLQQTSDQLKQGRIPMTFRMLATGNLVKLASPGDVIFVQGILTPFRKNGFFHQYDLAFQCHLEACQIIRQKKKYVQMAITQQDKHKINVIRANTQQDVLFEKLALSIAPEIYGLQHVKKALLLLMVGGTTKQTHDYLRIRGEINLLLLGDPGIAKSQLLKHISYLSPRGIYTTGKGSSGVGLTAAIVCDPYTKQLSLEAGALVLADMGICCIDQFDKMDEHDRTAIHQVMEQQTVSIAKAGITTNLNARSSILAAANPLFGRYNIKQSIQKNINLPSALVSRFDLIFILLDNNSKLQDLKLAEHIGHVHKNGEILNSSGIYQPIFLRNYIAMSKQYQPTISKVLHEQLIAKYIAKRKQHLNNEYCGSIYTSMRHLLGLIRLCQARAKLRFSNEVSSSDVYDCLEIMDESMKMVENSANVRKFKKDSISQIYSIIKNLCMYNQDKCCKMNELQKRIITKGYTNDELEITIKQYSNMNVLLVQNDKIILIE